MLDPLRDDRFAALSAAASCRASESSPRELLCDGACAFGRSPLAKIGDERSDQSDAVYAVVVVEANVFDCDDRLLQIR